jgi:hypothetical protein
MLTLSPETSLREKTSLSQTKKGGGILRIGSWNVKGCAEHKLEAILGEEALDILGIMETWLGAVLPIRPRASVAIQHPSPSGIRQPPSVILEIIYSEFSLCISYYELIVDFFFFKIDIYLQEKDLGG